MNNIKNIWKGIKLLITLTYISTSAAKTVNHNNSTVTNSVEISSICNNHITSAAEKTMLKGIASSYKDINEYMENMSPKSFFLSPINNNEINFKHHF